MLLTLLLLGLNTVSGDRCPSVPPSLWCDSKEISKECGFDYFCNRYHLAEYNKPINITLLMEGLCPYCQRWIVEELYPTIFKNFGAFVNIEIVPFGNARIRNGSITCQHGEEECNINLLESCAMHVLKSQDYYVPFIFCLEQRLQLNEPFDKASSICFSSLSVGKKEQELIESCTTSIIGKELQLNAAKKTANIWPDKHKWVPWIILNGVSLESKQIMKNHLPYLLCELYIGDQEIPYCDLVMKNGFSKNA